MGDTNRKNWWLPRIVVFVIFLFLALSCLLLRPSRQWLFILLSELSAAAAGVSLGSYLLGDPDESKPYTWPRRWRFGPFFAFFDERSKPLEELKKQAERTLAAAEKEAADKAAAEKAAAAQAAHAKAAAAKDAAERAAADKDATDKDAAAEAARKKADAWKDAAEIAAAAETAAKTAAEEDDPAKKAAADEMAKKASDAAEKAAAPKDPPEKVVERMLQPEYVIGQGLMTREEYNDFRNTFLAQSELSLGLIIPILLIIFAWVIKLEDNWSASGTLLRIVVSSCASSCFLFFIAMERRQKYRIELGLLLLSRWDKQRAADEAAKKAKANAKDKTPQDAAAKVVHATLTGLTPKQLEADVRIGPEKADDKGNAAPDEKTKGAS